TTFAGGVATFSPASGLVNGTAYTATVSAAAPDGTAMAPFSWAFTTMVAAPTVVATNPANLATGVATGASVGVTFSEAMDPTSLGLTLTDPTDNPVPASLASYNAATFTATFQPSVALTAGATYSASITGSAPDGTDMAAPFAWSFAVATGSTAPAVA